MEAAEHGTARAPRRSFSDEGAGYGAIAAIFAAFEPKMASRCRGTDA